MTDEQPPPERVSAEILRRIDELDLRVEFIAEGRASWVVADAEGHAVVERASDPPLAADDPHRGAVAGPPPPDPIDQ